MQHKQGPILTLHTGEGMTADEAAWSLIADAAERALILPGLSDAGAAAMIRVVNAARSAAGLPARSLTQPQTG